MPNFEKRFLAARRAVIEADYPHLNPMQRAAVIATEGPLLVLAGAGSGKTTVLIQRIANIIKYGSAADSDEIPDFIGEAEVEFLEAFAKKPNDDEREAAERLCTLNPAAPWSVIAITFTNKAAGELKERLSVRLGSRANEVWASTFHSACVRILRRDIDRLGYDRSFTIYDSSDSERLMKEIVRDLRLEEQQFAPKIVLRYISTAKDKMVWPEDFKLAFSDENDYKIERISHAYREYSRRMKEANALDFDDIILLAVTLLLQFDEVREYYQNKFRYVLIDEYQDTNNLQYILAKTLAGKWGNLCVVGDDDQSIYRFRGATVENILQFESQYKKARAIKLEQNYRSTGMILSAANGVIENNAGRKGKSLWTANDGGEKITVYTATNDGDEAQFVAKQILDNVAAGGFFRDHAVLYRMNALMNRVEDAFKRNGVPYRIIGGTRFFDRMEIKDITAYLAVIHNSSDDLRLGRILNTPTRGLGAKALEIIAFLAQQHRKPWFEIIAEASDYPDLVRYAPKLHAFADMILYLTETAKTGTLTDFYDEVLDKTGYIRALEAKEAAEPEVRTRIENVMELKSNIVTYEETAEEPSLDGFLDEISLFTDIDRFDTDADAVVLMTMHSAKGLEFPKVFLVGFEDGIFPSSRSIGFQEEMEEERRLCYVGITRAREQLFISHARQRMLFGRTSYSPASMFIGEIPPECVEEKKSEIMTRTYIEPRHTIEANPQRKFPVYSQKVASVPLPQIKKGDQITHTAFGTGLVLSLKPMGGDALLEIAFDESGTKRLMLKSASKFITKTGD